MNKKDFYKSLMSEYSFDADKIRSEAKKGRSAGRRALPTYIGATVAVAAVTVVVGTTMFSVLSNNHGVDLYPSNSTTLSASDRLKKALAQIEQNTQSSELHTVLVTFTEPLTPDQARAVLTAYGDDGSIPVERVYFEDGSKVSGESAVKTAFDGSDNITGAMVRCDGAVWAQLQRDERVWLAEEPDEGEIDTIMPVDISDMQTVEPQVPDMPAVPDNDQPVAPGVPAETPKPDESSETEQAGTEVGTVETDESEDYTNDGTVESSEETAQDDPDTSETAQSAESGETEPSVPTETAEAPDVPVDPDVPNIPVIDTPQEPESLPENVVLPENTEKFSYETVNIGAETAFFLSEQTFFVRSGDYVALYHFDGKSERLLTEAECAQAKICWIGENGGEMIVSGIGETGKRSKLLYINAWSESITDLCAEDTVIDGAISGVGYNKESGLLVLNIKENGSYYIYAMEFNGGELSYLSNCFGSDSRVTLLAACKNNIYFAVNNGSLTQIFRTDSTNGGASLIKTYDSEPEITSNLAFTHAVISSSKNAVVGFTEIFDPACEKFVSLGQYNMSVSFGASRHSFSADGSYFTVGGGSVASAGGIAVMGAVDYRKSLSPLYAASAHDGRVKVTESIYSAKAKSGNLTFGDLTDSVPAEIRETINGAIGLNNALALGKCAEAGIGSTDTLKKCVERFYSEKTAAKILSKCSGSGIPYYNGSLSAINVSDTVVSVKTEGDTASGALYVKVGSYGKRTGYLSRSIKLVKENGVWKLDTMLE